MEFNLEEMWKIFNRNFGLLSLICLCLLYSWLEYIKTSWVFYFKTGQKDSL